MKKSPKTLLIGASMIAILAMAGCGPSPTGEKGTEIINAGRALALLSGTGTVLVDANNGVVYKKRHAEGAVNIPRTAIVINKPVSNMLAPASRIEEVMGASGIGNDTLVLVYDDNQNMDAARFWFTLKVYGHDKVKVISGGLNALAEAGAKVVKTAPMQSPVSFTAKPLNQNMLIHSKTIRKNIENPPDDYVLVDTRSIEEFNEGAIPGSLCLDFRGNNYRDATFKPINQIRIRYLENKIDYNDDVALYCKTSIRGAQTYLVLYNAGYRNLKLYDGAWVEWISNPMNPVYIPQGADLNLNAADQS